MDALRVRVVEAINGAKMAQREGKEAKLNEVREILLHRDSDRVLATEFVGELAELQVRRQHHSSRRVACSHDAIRRRQREG